MSNGEIKTECELQYQAIRAAEQRLEESRSICEHLNTFEGNYSYRIGASLPAIICCDCGSLIKFTFDYMIGDTPKKY